MAKKAAVYGGSGVLKVAILGQSWRNRGTIRIFVLMEQNRNSSIRLHIRNMVCPRCISAVRGIFERAGYHVEAIELGAVTVSPVPDEAALSRLQASLSDEGFALLSDRREQLVERIKNLIVEMVHYSDDRQRQNLSSYLSEHLGHDYGSMSRIFSEMTGTTIEKYWISQRIERVKELLSYGELTLEEIADRMGYSSSAHLSSQFKRVTGMTAGEFRRSEERRRPIDTL